MRPFILTATLFFSLTSFSAPYGDIVNRSIKREPVLTLVQKMGQVAYGYSTDNLAGLSEKEMIKNFFKGFDQIVFDQNKVVFGDEVTVGTLSAKGLESLLNQFAMEDHFRDPEADPEQNSQRSKYTAEEAEALIRKAVNALKPYGVTFGYTSSGGYCGVSFVGLVVFDFKTKKAYTITLAPSGPC